MVEILLVFVSIMLLICLCVFLTDGIPIFMSWLKRIHIGRYTDKKVWRKSAEKVAEKNIKKLPPLPITDRTHYTLIPRLKGAYYNFCFNIWQVASLLRAMPDNSTAQIGAYRFFEKEDWKNRNCKAESAMLFYAMLCSGYENDEKLKAAMADYVKKAIDAAGDKTLPYVLERKERYVDTLGMVCPFLIKYHQTYNAPEMFELAKRQFDEFFRYGIHEKTGLPVHCFNPDSGMPLGAYGWGRGCGWLALALDESIALLDGKDEYADVLKERAEQLIKALLPYQNEDGSFNALIGVKDSRRESSATAMIGGLLCRMGYRKEAEKCLSYLMKVTRRNGEVDFVQGDTMGIGNYSRRFEPMPAAQGFALELERKLG